MENKFSISDQELDKFIEETQNYIDMIEMHISILERFGISDLAIEEFKNIRGKLLLDLMEIMALRDERAILSKTTTLFQYGKN